MKFGLLVTVDNTEELTKAIRLLNKEGLETATTEVEETKAHELYNPTATELRNMLIEVKELKGGETAKEILAAHGAKTLKALDKEEYATVYATAKNILDEPEDEPEDDELEDELEDEFEDDELEDDEDMDVPEPEVVKVMVQKYAKRNGKENTLDILKKHGLNTVRGLKAASDEALLGIFKAIS